MEQHKRLGEIFVAKGIISTKTKERVLLRAKAQAKRFGAVLEEMELITGEELAEALAIQYRCKVIRNLPDQEIQPEMLKLISVGVAMQNMIFPLKREQNMLALAMADPTNTRAADNLAADNGLKIVPFVASRKDIHAAICIHYLGRQPASPQEKTVLIVEDDKTVLTILSDILNKNGYQVTAAMDGMEAFKTVIAQRPRVILTDKEMPKLDGYGLLGALKNLPETQSIPVIMVTGKAMNAEEEARAFDKGFFDYITKPVHEVTLLPRVKRAFQIYSHQQWLF